MDPTVITYLSFLVALLILLWAGVEIGRRLYKRKRIDARIMHTWQPLQAASRTETEDGEPDNAPQADLPTRAQQNGHYSESKKL
jgi:hypothetical protein